MRRLIKKKSHKTGLPPGTLIHIGTKKAEKTKITLTDYDEAHYEEKEVKTVDECFPFSDKSTVTWINIDGIHEVNVIEKIGKHFNLHPLVMEDIVNTGHRPKVEDFDDYLFVVLKMIYHDDKNGEVGAEQVSLIIGSNFVISFQEQEGAVFNPIRERMRGSKGRIRKMGADYLAYALLDMIVDNYFIILEKLGEKVENLEEELVSNPTSETSQEIHRLKGDMIFLRKSVWPLREVVNGLTRGESSLIKESTGIYLRDVYDHTIQVIDTLETYRDVVSGMVDTYLATLSNRMNEVMKVLTVIAVIFMPLTFIAGIYGMNFNPEASPWNMPELNWRYGYLSALGVMMLIGLGMIIYFKRKKWL